jgi:hypothetical protein
MPGRLRIVCDARPVRLAAQRAVASPAPSRAPTWRLKGSPVPRWSIQEEVEPATARRSLPATVPRASTGVCLSPASCPLAPWTQQTRDPHTAARLCCPVSSLVSAYMTPTKCPETTKSCDKEPPSGRKRNDIRLALVRIDWGPADIGTGDGHAAIVDLVIPVRYSELEPVVTSGRYRVERLDPTSEPAAGGKAAPGVAAEGGPIRSPRHDFDRGRIECRSRARHRKARNGASSNGGAGSEEQSTLVAGRSQELRPSCPSSGFFGESGRFYNGGSGSVSGSA